jgi:tetratricopeptide (TPR) repeat protein
LAGLLDNQARRDEASGLRDAALASAAAEHGAASAEVVRIRVTQLASLRVSGRLVEAEAGAWQCLDRAKGMHDVLLPCLMARAETALDSGSDLQAADFAAKALVEAETHWTRAGGTVLPALILQARVEAALGDVDAVIRLYDRIHGLSPDKGISRAWTDYGEGQLLAEAGEPTLGLAMLRLALKQGKDAHNTGLAVAATFGLAGQLEKTGRWEEAMGLWQGVLPLLSDDAPANRVRVLEGLGTAAAGMAQYRDAARVLGEAVALSRTVTGVGSPDYGRLVVAWSAALMRSGEPDKAEDAIRLLDADTSPAARRLRTTGMMHLALMADDPAAAVMLAHSEVADATAAFGADSVGAALARLDLIEESLAADRYVNGAELDDALRGIEAQVPNWAVAYRGDQLRGELAAHTGRLGDAAAAFVRAEVLASAREGPRQPGGSRCAFKPSIGVAAGGEGE